MLRPFSLHAALGQALLHAAVLPAATTSMLAHGLSRRMLSRLVGAGSSAAASGGGSAFRYV